MQAWRPCGRHYTPYIGTVNMKRHAGGHALVLHPGQDARMPIEHFVHRLAGFGVGPERYAVAVVLDVEREVLTHHAKADHAEPRRLGRHAHR